MKKSRGHIPKAGKAFIDRLIAKHGLMVIRTIQHGPRFFVAEVQYGRKRALFKVCIHPKSKDRWTNRKFGKEILFLKFLGTNGHRRARTLAPRIYEGGVDSRAWYIREYINGQFYNINGGNIRFRDAFFTTAHLTAIVVSFSDLQSITKIELPADFRKRLARYDTINHSWKLLSPYWGRIARFLGDQKAKDDLPKLLLERQAAFDRTPAVLAHQEPYASHFVQTGGKLRLIDWENINWTNPVHDYTNLWMRASAHPAWQKKLRARAQRTTAPLLGTDFNFVWNTSMLIKAVFNVLSFPYYTNKEDFRALATLSKKLLRTELAVFRAS
jgi:hypothetical protein